jgi:hypothetical protein
MWKKNLVQMWLILWLKTANFMIIIISKRIFFVQTSMRTGPYEFAIAHFEPGSHPIPTFKNQKGRPK